jgi:hypothetical protein
MPESAIADSDGVIIFTDKEIARFASKYQLGPIPKHCPELENCWVWTAGKDKGGYGKYKMRGQHLRAHRVAFMMSTGHEIPKGAGAHGTCVIHKCDNPSCIRPSHLRLGSNDENMADMVAKRRAARGDRHGSRTHPESVPRGDRHGLRLHPEARARGDRHGSRTHPERLARGDNHYYRRHPECIPRGVAHPRSILNPDRVRAIRARRAAGTTFAQIAHEQNVSLPTVASVIYGQTWGHVK